ncbi:MAG: NAD(P)H-dependent oxidoreductase [Parasphingorhabdus sp.]|uniref:NADPH-dependent FMN reductase n=1 Tax=Alphaproteobacteria TaxID=28211 RepID=UPI0032679930
MQQNRILVLSGSTRSGSFNTKLAALVTKQLALADAEVTRISLSDYPLPLYDGDLEANRGVPQNAQTLKELFCRQDGVFIACPEYNAGVTPVLKNAIDWISRLSGPGEPPSAAFKNRVFALGSASTGGFGGMRGLIGMRTILEVGLGATVLPQMITVSSAANAFTGKGDLADGRSANILSGVVQALNHQSRLQSMGR